MISQLSISRLGSDKPIRVATLATAMLAVSACCVSGRGRIEPRPQSDYDERVAELARRAPLGSTPVIAPPFVVIGDDSPQRVEAVTEDVVVWATRRLKQDFFPLDPSRIVEIWAFRDATSYLENGNVLFGSVPTTPYGYYDPCEHAVIVNIGLGAGTLVHEIVHVFMDANFPDAPTWFNEGLASLYEQPVDVNGHIRGKTNWRLAGLQNGIRNGSLVTLTQLMSTSRGEFYAEKRQGMHYAMARYLLYYLQSEGRLVPFYRHFSLNHAADPTGLESLRAITEVRDLGQFEAAWQRYALDLRFPE